ncbi:MAG: polyprenyl synthetase family protein [Rhodobacter sp.]|nr:polyprenyl synthetase family protein [Rhodobacter sp.]
MSFTEKLAAHASRVQSLLDAYMSFEADTAVSQAMRYAVQGGKGFRGFLVMESTAMFGIDPERAIWPAAAIEAMHAYSLVHDDLPCMDDDTLRRGRPTVHVKWDEATAVLAGDALQTVAFDLLANMREDAEVRVRLISDLARSSGAEGMVLGQAQDIAAETAETPLTLGEITALQRNKTGALIEWSCAVGPIYVGAVQVNLRRYARALGLAFQIADDILDVEGDSKAVGKRLRKDGDAGKATFVSLLGLEGAKARAAELVAEAEASLEPYGDRAGTLREAARFVISRRM